MDTYEALWNKLSEYVVNQYVDAQIEARDRFEDDLFDTENTINPFQRKTLYGSAVGREYAFGEMLELMNDLKYGRK